MNKFMFFYVFFALVVIVAIVLFFLKKPDLRNIVLEKRDFTCPVINGYTFQYPIFKGLEHVKQDLCHLRILTDKQSTFVWITVNPVENQGQKFELINPNGILYRLGSYKDEYIVKLGDDRIVSIRAGSTVIFASKSVMMKLEEYSKTIIESLSVDTNQ